MTRKGWQKSVAGLRHQVSKLPFSFYILSISILLFLSWRAIKRDVVVYYYKLPPTPGNILPMLKPPWLKTGKDRSRRYTAQTITDADSPMTLHLWQIHLPEPNPCYIDWDEHLLASMSTKTRRNICDLFIEATSSH